LMPEANGQPMGLDAPGKINFCLALGPLREDGYHDVVSVVLPLDLADRLVIEPSNAERDQVICPGVDGDNLVSAALARWREASGWDGKPVRVTIEKRVPVAAGMGGGSADAAAALRLVAAWAGRPDDPLLNELAPGLGADVAPLLHGGPTLVEGIGDRVTALPLPAAVGLLILPASVGLSTPVVFARAGEMGLRRSSQDITAIAEAIKAEASAPGWDLPAGLLGLNDLGPAAADLEPAVSAGLDEARAAGADQAFVTGSGPTVVGLFAGPDGPERAKRAAEGLAGRVPAAVFATASPGSGTIEQLQ